MEVLKNLRKIINQALGRENMFGFQTTQANQFYFMYCILGNVFFTDKVHRIVKYAWFACTYVYFSFLFLIILATYVIYGVQPKDTLLLIYTVFLLLFYLLEVVFVPINVIVWNKNNIENMIIFSDKILLKNSDLKSEFINEFDIKKLTITVAGIYIIMLTLYVIISIACVPVFYEEEKAKNYLYYTIPLSGLQHYGSLKFFIYWTSSLILPGIEVFTVFTVQSLFPVLVAAVCHNEMCRIIKQLNSLSAESDINIDAYQNIESKFRQVLSESILAINDLTRMISCFRGFFEPMCGVLMAFFLYIQIIHALILVNPNYTYVVKMREIAAFIPTILQVYSICWVGQILQDLTDALGFAVYSTPWYKLKSVRKDVYITLCQAQKSNFPVALNVYPLNYSTFLRFCNAINSAVNVFRAALTRH